MSETTRKSSAARRSATRLRSGAETTMLEASTISVRTPPSVPSRSIISYADSPGRGKRLRVDPPDRRHVGTVGRIVELAVAGQLVGLLTVLAAALPVALSGDRAVAGVRPPGQAEGQRQVDVGQRGVGPGAVLLGSARGQDHRRLRAGQGADRAVEVVDGDAGDPLDPVRPVGRRPRPGRPRSRWCGRRCSRGRSGPAGSRDGAGRWPARDRCPAAVAGASSSPAQSRSGADRRRCAARPPRGRRRTTAWPVASSRPGSSRPAGSPSPRRCRPAGTAARGRCRTRGSTAVAAEDMQNRPL